MEKERTILLLAIIIVQQWNLKRTQLRDHNTKRAKLVTKSSLSRREHRTDIDRYPVLWKAYLFECVTNRARVDLNSSGH